MPRLNKQDAWEAATAVVSDLESLASQLDEVAQETRAQQLSRDIRCISQNLYKAANDLMDLEC